MRRRDLARTAAAAGCAVAVALGGSASGQGQRNAPSKQPTIAFVSTKTPSTGLPFHRVMLMNADGTRQRSLFGRYEHAFTPDISPDGRQIAYSVGDSDGADLYVADIDGGNRRLVVQAERPATAPEFSGDGSKIVYVCSVQGNGRICVVDVDGSNNRMLSRTNEYEVIEIEPSFSPDGRWVVFSKRPSFGKKARLMIMRSDGSKRRTLAADGHTGHFSPSGRRILFTSFPGSSQAELYTIRRNGSHKRRLTRTHRLSEFDARYSHSGRLILMTGRKVPCDAGVCYHTYTLRSDGSHERKLTKGAVGDAAGATWR